jgi:hypothetical protein
LGSTKDEPKIESAVALIIDQTRISELVLRPSEALNIEVKRWIDPQQDAGVAIIVKAVFALRNRNGGFLVLGFDDQTLQPDHTNRPSDVRAAFHLDDVQAIVSRYASEPFEIGIGFEMRDGQEHAVIVVSEGVLSPVAIKRDLNSAGKQLFSVGDIYFRTLNANGTPSSARARPEDWPDIVQICFDNREADLGRFVRRHLTAPNLTSVLETLGIARSPPPPNLREQAAALLIDGQRRFDAALSQRQVTQGEKSLTDAVSWSIAVVVDPQKSNAVADGTFLATFASSNPNYAGWPVWIDARFLTDQAGRPKVIDNGWGALIISPQPGWSNKVDFWRLDPNGKFYLRRLLQDDTVPKMVRPGSVLDPVLAVLRVAEVITVGLSAARALSWHVATTRLEFAFQWTKLKGRKLNAWAYPLETMLVGGGTAHDDQVESFVEVPLETPISAIAPFVAEATSRLIQSY